MRKLMAIVIAVLFTAPLTAQSPLAGQPRMDVSDGPALAREVGIDQRLDELVPLDIRFQADDGRGVALGDLLTERPTILVLAYFRCPKLCSEVLNGLARTLRLMSLEIGKDYDVITVSFDPSDTPEMAALKKRSYLELLGREGAAENWHFLTGTQESIDRLTRAVGFRYRYDPERDQYAHAGGLMVLTPQGRLSRYFYGVRFSPRDLRLGLVEASSGKIGSPVDQVLLLCLHYDARSGTYRSVMSVMRVAGAATLLVLGSALVIAWRRERRRSVSPVQ